MPVIFVKFLVILLTIGIVKFIVVPLIASYTPLTAVEFGVP
jgi:hypothetical protein